MDHYLTLVAQGIELAMRHCKREFSSQKDALDYVLSWIDISKKDFLLLYPNGYEEKYLEENVYEEEYLSYEMAADGGCRGNGKTTNVGGYGFVIKGIKTNSEDTLTGYGVQKDTTNNVQELKGCILALKYVYEQLEDLSHNCMCNKPIKLYTDSQYVYEGITNYMQNWKTNGFKTAAKKPIKNKELWMELDRLKNLFSNLCFIKVAGHADHELNILADQLANKAMDLGGE